MDNIIEVKNATFEYDDGDQKDVILNDFNINIKRGSFTVILGHNGSGKSTLAKKVGEYLENKNGLEKYEVALLAYDIENIHNEVENNKKRRAIFFF